MGSVFAPRVLSVAVFPFRLSVTPHYRYLDIDLFVTYFQCLHYQIIHFVSKRHLKTYTAHRSPTHLLYLRLDFRFPLFVILQPLVKISRRCRRRSSTTTTVASFPRSYIVVVLRQFVGVGFFWGRALSAFAIRCHAVSHGRSLRCKYFKSNELRSLTTATTCQSFLSSGLARCFRASCCSYIDFFTGTSSRISCVRTASSC